MQGPDGPVGGQVRKQPGHKARAVAEKVGSDPVVSVNEIAQLPPPHGVQPQPLREEFKDPLLHQAYVYKGQRRRPEGRRQQPEGAASPPCQQPQDQPHQHACRHGGHADALEPGEEAEQGWGQQQPGEPLPPAPPPVQGVVDQIDPQGEGELVDLHLRHHRPRLPGEGDDQPAQLVEVHGQAALPDHPDHRDEVGPQHGRQIEPQTPAAEDIENARHGRENGEAVDLVKEAPADLGQALHLEHPQRHRGQHQGQMGQAQQDAVPDKTPSPVQVRAHQKHQKAQCRQHRRQHELVHEVDAQINILRMKVVHPAGQQEVGPRQEAVPQAAGPAACHASSAPFRPAGPVW